MQYENSLGILMIIVGQRQVCKSDAQRPGFAAMLEVGVTTGGIPALYLCFDYEDKSIAWFCILLPGLVKSVE